MVVGGLALLVLLTTPWLFDALLGPSRFDWFPGIGHYPKSLLGTDVEAVSNAYPPTVCFLLGGLWTLGAVMLIKPFLDRWLQHERPWRFTIVVNARIMTLFLWHMTAFLLALLALWPGFGTQQDSTARWWIERPLWFVAPSLVLLGLVAIFGRFERPTRADRGRGARRPEVASAVELASLATGTGSRILLLVIDGLGGSPTPSTGPSSRKPPLPTSTDWLARASPDCSSRSGRDHTGLRPRPSRPVRLRPDPVRPRARGAERRRARGAATGRRRRARQPGHGGRRRRRGGPARGPDRRRGRAPRRRRVIGNRRRRRVPSREGPPAARGLPRRGSIRGSRTRTRSARGSRRRRRIRWIRRRRRPPSSSPRSCVRSRRCSPTSRPRTRSCSAASTRIELPRFTDRTGLRAPPSPSTRCTGIARLLGFDVLGPPPTHGPGTLLEKHREDADLFFVHVKDADAAGEDGDRTAKIAAIERVDAAIPDLRTAPTGVIAVTGDHATPSQMAAHSWHAVPALVHGPRSGRDGTERFGERWCRAGDLGIRPSMSCCRS